jgi:cytosine/adenosine deaminase-related metal-dependent hydrolase
MLAALISSAGVRNMAPWQQIRTNPLQALDLPGDAPLPDAPDTLVVHGASIVPMTENTVLGVRTVVIVDGIIDQVLEPGDPAPAAGDAIDGRGRYLVPGLIDFHVHLRDESELLSYLAHGVTTVVNMRGSPEHLRLAGCIANGEVLGPWVYSSGPLIDGIPPIWDGPGTVAVTSSEEARAAVEEQARSGYDLIKTYNNLDQELLQAVIDAARREGLAVVGHIPRNPDRSTALPRALDAGMAMIAHGEEIFFTQLGGAPDRTMRDAPRPIERDRIREAARLVAGSGAAVTPNLSFIAMTARMLDDLEAVLEHREAGYLSPAVLEMWQESNPTRRDDLEAFKAREAIKRPVVQALALELQRLGVPLLLGTDASAPGLYPGWSAILELEELVAAGLTPYEALSAGTRTAGAFLERHVRDLRSLGTIEPGKAADLILVEGNPLMNISALRDPVGVVLRGQWIARDSLQTLREHAKRSVRSCF